MLVKVTQEHIDKGISYIGNRCPVALALKDSGFINVHVGVYSVYESTEKDGTFESLGEVIASLPGEVQKFIRIFDQQHVAKPIEFELDDSKITAANRVAEV